MKKHTSQTGHVAAIAAGLAVAAAAGAYFLYGTKNAKKYRSTIKSWIFMAKAEILERIENVEHISEEEYNMIVDKVATKYKSMKGIHEQDVARFIVDLKKQWKSIRAHVMGGKKKKSGKKS